MDWLRRVDKVKEYEQEKKIEMERGERRGERKTEMERGNGRGRRCRERS
jgi:hypothetical protein